MSKFQARVALDQLVGRPALVSPAYVGQSVGVNPEVTSGAMMTDIRELATAVPADEIAAYQDRCSLLAATYGYDVVSNEKPFIFADGVALIPIHGMLLNRFSYSWGFVTGYNFLRNQVAAAVQDEDVEAIVFDVNSCGGMVAGCQETADLMFEANAANGGKPLIAVVDANCHSAAYFLASQCDFLAITPSGNCANIGVLQIHADISAMLSNMGVKISLIYAGAHKVDGTGYQPLSDEARAIAQSEIDAIYDVFVAAVARGRGMDEQAVRDTEARCYSANEALALGLVDAIQNPSDAVEAYFASCEDGDDDGEADPGDTPDDEQPEPTEKKMAVKPNGTTKPGTATADGSTEVTSEASAQAIADGRAEERRRIGAIQGHAEAVGRTTLATHLAMNTDMDVEAAASILAAAPKEAAPVAEAPKPTGTETPKPEETSEFHKAMDKGQQPNVGDGGGSGGGAEASGDLTPAQRILTAQRNITGVAAPTKH